MAETKNKMEPDHNQELFELGKKLEAFYQMGYVDKKSAFWFTFWKGVIYGLGVFIGGTVAVGLLLWLVSGLDKVPLIGPVVKAVQRTVQ